MTTPDSDNLTIVIPAFNEAEGIDQVLEDLKKLMASKPTEIIVIDDGSSDGTGEIARKHQIKVIRHDRNLGYGASLKSGIKEAKNPYILIMDADGQHRMEDVKALADFPDKGDMIVGARKNLLPSPIWRMPGKWIINLLACYLVNYSIPDLNSGLRLMKKEVLQRYIHLCPQGFSFSTTITMAMLHRGCQVKFIPIEVLARVGKSTVSISTGFETILLILRLTSLFNPLRIFFPISFLSFLSGIFWGMPYIIQGHGVSVGALLAITTSLILFSIGLICDMISQLRLERYE